MLRNAGVADWEAALRQWARSPSQTERTRCDNAIRIIRNAIDAHWRLGPELRAHRIKVFTQGSYRNRVNVRADSDVDVGVLYSGAFFAQYPAGYDASYFRHVTATYTYQEFKDDLEGALIDRLGSTMVTRGNKSIRLRETSYHVEADAAPFFQHFWYLDPNRQPIPGVELRPDNRPLLRVVNYPEALFSGWPNEHYENGLEKNTATHRRYRGLVRILKNLRNKMDEAGSPAAKAVPGYLLECLTWNAPNASFASYTWSARVQAVLRYLWSSTMDEASCQAWREVDNIKLLFGPHQAWSRAQAHAFLDTAWDYVGVG